MASKIVGQLTNVSGVFESQSIQVPFFDAKKMKVCFNVKIPFLI